MTFYDTLFEVIDMRSFSNLWFWIALAVLWSTVSHWVLGVPYDMIIRARRSGGEAMDDMETLVRVSVKRILMIADVAGVILVLVVSSVFTAFAIMAFWYWMEFAQALLLLLGPLGILALLSVRAARSIRDRGLAGEALVRRLMAHRFATQMLGVISIFVTAMFGMYQNLAVGYPGF